MKEDPFTATVQIRMSPCDVCGKMLAIDKPGWVILGSRQMVCYSKEGTCADKLLVR